MGTKAAVLVALVLASWVPAAAARATPPLGAGHTPAAGVTFPHGTASQRAQPVLRSYQINTSRVKLGQPIPQPLYGGMLYRPRQFTAGLTLDVGDSSFAAQQVTDAGRYERWDVLSLPNLYFHTIGAQQDYLELKLNRPATIAVIWRAFNVARPDWLSDWTPGGSVTVNGRDLAVYRKNVAAGRVLLGKVGAPAPSGSQNYTVLLAEYDGAPSTPPHAPSGRETPAPNTACPNWVHDQYVARGPDGRSYPTWHPKIDEAYWCYFGHEHGSDPKLAGVDDHGRAIHEPLYGYTASTQGMSEPHSGFKTHVVKDRLSGHWWLWTVHMGSSGVGRVCQRHHTLDVAVVVDGSTKASIHLLGDFGRAKYAGPQNSSQHDNLITGCSADQRAIRDMGSRRLVTDSSGYEPWVVDNEYNVTGLHPDFFHFKTNFPATDCANPPLCTQLKTATHGQFGTVRLLEYGRPRVVAGDHARNAGAFYTDGHGRRFLDPQSPDRVRQYIQPGFSSVMARPIDPSGNCSIWDAWTEEYRCDRLLIDVQNNLEGAVRFGN